MNWKRRPVLRTRKSRRRRTTFWLRELWFVKLARNISRLVTTNPSIVNSGRSPGQFGGLQSGSSFGSGLTVKSFTDYSLPFDASWEPDFWGRVRNTVRANVYAAQASAADLENVRLDDQAELAVDYYELRAQDSLKERLGFHGHRLPGNSGSHAQPVQGRPQLDEAVAQAEAQLKAAQAQDTNLGILRAQYEHAIAVLIGQPASTFSLRANALAQDLLPQSRLGIPSELLERRPDIAAAERSVAQANAEIGVAKAAYFPTILLSASGGFGTPRSRTGLHGPAAFGRWAQVLPKRFLTLACARRPSSSTARPTIKPWRTTSKPCSRRFSRSKTISRRSESCRRISNNKTPPWKRPRGAFRKPRRATRAGLDPYLNVISAQTILLNDQQTAVTFRMEANGRERPTDQGARGRLEREPSAIVAASGGKTFRKPAGNIAQRRISSLLGNPMLGHSAKDKQPATALQLAIRT